MQTRLKDLVGVTRGLRLIFNATAEHSLNEAATLFSHLGQLKIPFAEINKAFNLEEQLKVITFVLDRSQLLLKQNVIIFNALSNYLKNCETSPAHNEVGSSGSETPHSFCSTITDNTMHITLDESDLTQNTPHPVDSNTVVDIKSKDISMSRERRVPSSRLGRIAGFGNLALSLGLSAATEWTKRTVGFGSSRIEETSALSTQSNPFLTEANLERIVDTLCRMRGAALKLGQMLSIQDESVVSPQFQKVFERVRQAADFMPARQMRKVISNELGEDWSSRVAEFEEKPFAAASIGQVHRAVLPDGRAVAMKIQYPGVADSIDADINNLMTVLKRVNALPRGLFADRAMEIAKLELRYECDYVREAEYAKRFRDLLADDPVFQVPQIIEELTTSRVLTAELVEGLVMDDCVSLPQDIRNWLGEQLLRLCLMELFVFRVMQTDPNWSNFLYSPKTGKITLLDFGASREYSKYFVDIYIRLIHAASEGDKQAILEYSRQLGFLTGYETKIMEQAHIDAVSILGEAFAHPIPFDFGHQSTTKRINHLIPIMLEHRLTAPPDESYSLHRKMSGCFLLCGKLKAVVNCRHMFISIWRNYTFDNVEPALSNPSIISPA